MANEWMGSMSPALREKGIVLFFVDTSNYADQNMRILNTFLTSKDFSCIYVTLDRPYSYLNNLLKGNGVETNRFFFIDCATKVISGTEGSENVVFLQTPQNLTKLDLFITRAIESMPPAEKRFIFFDSLSTLLIYNPFSTVAQFIHHLTNTARIMDISMALISVKQAQYAELVSTLGRFCDTTIEVV